MPTTRPRTQITHTPEVERALEIARRAWPEEGSTSALLAHLILEGANAIAHREDTDAARRRELVQAISGKYSDAYGPGYLEDVREGWPA